MGTMVSPSRAMLDLLLVTFNCGKAITEPKPFASVLYHSFRQNAVELPDLVVLSLQEISPVTDAYLGGKWLHQYYRSFEQAVNLAATKIISTTASGNDAQRHDQTTDTRPVDFEDVRVMANTPYTLVRTKNVGMTAILLFARDPATLHNIQEAETGFGTMNMGNKGAVALRVTYKSPEARSTELTFVAAHLLHGETGKEQRNEHWKTMVAELTFEDPKKVLEDSKSTSVGRNSESDTTPLLSGGGERHDDDVRVDAGLHQISMFRPSSHLFVFGDLNYRVSDTEPKKSSGPVVFPSFKVSPDDERHWSHFLPRDQLSIERAAGRTCHGLSEAEIKFGPSYKYHHLKESEIDEAENADEARQGHEVPWTWAPHRWPSWCDRILFLNIGGWVKRRKTNNSPGEVVPTDLEVKAYDILPLLASSDHRPVFLRVNVPILSPEEMAPPPMALLAESELSDPRVRLPVPINVDSWEKRRAGRRAEVRTGWIGLYTTTKRGAVLLGGALVVCGLSWYFTRRYQEQGMRT